MTFIDMNLGDVPEVELLPEDRYTVRIEDAEMKQGGPGKADRISIRVTVDGHPNTDTIFHSLFLPGPDDDDRKRNFKLRAIMKFCDIFEIPYKSSGFNIEEFPGSAADVLIVQEDYEGTTSNRLRVPLK